MDNAMRYLILLIAAVLFLTAAENYAQSPPGLTITAPSDGTMIQPGQSLTVTVQGSNVPASSQEGLLVSGRIPSPALQTSASSNVFVLTIPSNLGPGTYDITAVETSANGPIDSATISVILQPSQFEKLQIDTAFLLFQNLTEQFPLIVTGFVDGASQQVPSQFLTFKSSDPSIAEVDSNGIVTPISAGTTQVTASYATLAATTKVTVAGAFLSLPTASFPTFTPAAGTFTAAQTVTLSDTITGATIYYTSDGTTPTTSSAVYSSPLSVRTTETIQAIAVASGYSQSPVASATYTINIPVAATPAFNPAAGIFTSAQTVTISDATAGAAVYYTTDGTAPTASSTLYSGPITVSSTETIQAIATASGYSNSAVASAAYTINLPQDFTLGLSASSLSVAAGQSGTVTASVGPVNGFSQAVSFACSGLSSGAACSFSPATVTPNGTASATTTVTISTSATAGLLGENRPYELAGLVAGLSLLFAGRRFRKLGRIGVLLLLMIGVGSAVSCGGGSSASKSTPTPTTSTVSINATSGSLTHTASLSLTVQ